MSESTLVTAWAYASGHIILLPDTETPPEGTLPLIRGPYENVLQIMEGNFESHISQNGNPFWAFVPLLRDGPSVGYMLLMTHLSKIRDLYKDIKGLTFYINKAANKEIRRATARVINTTMH